MRIAADHRAVALAALVLVAGGCGPDPVTTLRRLGSWVATGAMLADAWADGATPRAYTEQTLERAQRELAEQARELGKLPVAQRTAATAVTERAARSLRELARAIQAEDRATVRRLSNTLADDARRLQEFAERGAS